MQRFFPAEPASVPAARRFVVDIAPGLPEPTTHALALLVSELATNCVVHAGTGFRVTVDLLGGKVRVEVLDSGAGHAQLRSPSPEQANGRGLHLVSALSDEWGIVPSPTQQGKTVWFTLTIPSTNAVAPKLD